MQLITKAEMMKKIFIVLELNVNCSLTTQVVSIEIYVYILFWGDLGVCKRVHKDLGFISIISFAKCYATVKNCEAHFLGFYSEVKVNKIHCWCHNKVGLALVEA